MFRKLMLAALLACAPTAALAGLAATTADGAASTVFEPAEFRDRFVAAFPGVETFLFDPPALSAPVCDPARGARTFALTIAADAIGPGMDYRLNGPVNDAALLRSALVSGGATDANIVTLAGEAATRDGLAKAALELLAKAGCDDTVIVHFSGWTFHAGELAFGTDGSGPFERGEKSPSLAEFKDRHPGAIDIAQLADSGPFLALNHGEDGAAQVVSAPALSELVTQFRNRLANVIVILDSRYVAGTDLQARQARVDPARLWSETQIPFAPETTYQEIAFPEPTRLAARHGGLTTFYAAGRDDPAFEMSLPRGARDGKIYGIFTYKVAVAMLANGRATVPDLARRIETVSLAGGDRDAASDVNHRYIFETTDPSLAMIAEQRPPRIAPQKAIRLTNPSPTRAAAPKTSPEIEIRGLVEWPEQTLIVTINRQQALLGPDGHFSLPVKLKAGVNEIAISALTRDDVFHELTTEVVYEGDREALKGTGTRYAVLIANQNYAPSSGMSRLETPFADVDALAGLLTEKFGYVTEATFDGRPIPLILKDASGSQIADLLFQVSQFAGDADSVLIYYAGHGIYEQVTGAAFWVPADARAGYPPSYFDPDNLSKALTRIQAGNVLVISDSCYSGQLLRGDGAAERIQGEDRLLALQRLSDRRSRILITSGGNEPVADTGGGGHSVFARALLTGLEGLEEDAFSARELFDVYIVPMVFGRAAQEPQYRAIEKSGHEGGDVVFVRSKS